MKNEQINTRGFGNFISSALSSTVGGFLAGQKQKEEEKTIAQKQAQVRETLSTIQGIRALERENLLESQRQRQARNLSVQASSGFEASSFDILNTSGLSKEQTDITLFDLQSKLQDQETMAGMPSQKGSWAKIGELTSGIYQGIKIFG